MATTYAYHHVALALWKVATLVGSQVHVHHSTHRAAPIMRPGS